MSHHSEDPKTLEQLDEHLRKFVEGIPGPTGRFPNGKLVPGDEGETRIAVANKDGVVIVNFGKPTAWVGFTKDEIRGFIELLTKHADVIDPPQR